MTMQKFSSSHVKSLNGIANIPGDKSISHRALMLGGIALGETIIHGLLEGEDVINTANAMRQMGADISCDKNNVWHCHGVGIGGLKQPDNILEMGNSGTSTRLLMGLVGGHAITATFCGDDSLNKRPMGRVIKPLKIMGVEFVDNNESQCLPLTLKGPETITPIEYELPVASAQVKSCVMLAGLSAKGDTSIIESIPTRDHTENMLRAFGVPIDIKDLDNGGQKITVTGQKNLKGMTIHVPSDPSSAAFPTVAALICEGSIIQMKNVLMNERRNGLYTTLIEMGADITFENARLESGEEVADLLIKGTKTLKGIDVPATRVPSMIDEFPILAVAASCANGTTTMTGLSELRVKESDRLLMMYNGLKACGVDIEMGDDWLTIHGTGNAPKGGAEVKTALDHRIAMSFMILGMATNEALTIDDVSPIQTSFPNFIDLMTSLGASMRPKE